MGQRLQMSDRISDDRLLLRDAGGQQRQRRRERERRQQLLLSVFLLKLLQQKDQLHSDRGQTAAVGTAEAAVTQQSPKQGLIGCKGQDQITSFTQLSKSSKCLRAVS